MTDHHSPAPMVQISNGDATGHLLVRCTASGRIAIDILGTGMVLRMRKTDAVILANSIIDALEADRRLRPRPGRRRRKRKPPETS